MSYKKILSLLFCFLLVLPFLLAEDTITFNAGTIEKPNPRITVTYNETDAPIVLNTIDSKLYRVYGGVRNPEGDIGDLVQISAKSMIPSGESSPGLDAWDQFQFQIESYLADGEYVLDLYGNKYDSRAPNNLGKEHHLEIIFTVNAETMNMWVSQPRIPFIQPASAQDVAVGDSTQFTLEIQTQFDTICSIQAKPSGALSPESYFGSGDKFNGGSQIATTVHSILVVDDMFTEYTNDNTVLTVPDAFNYQSYDRSADYLIICKQEIGNGEPLYHQKILYVGYDTTPPVIDVEFGPETIIDPNDMVATLNVSSQEDFLACEYRFIEKPPQSITSKKESDLPTSLVPMSQQYTGIVDYTTFIEKEFDLGNDLLNGEHNYGINQEHFFEAEVICSNLAGLTSQSAASFLVNLNYDLTIGVQSQGGLTLYGDFYNYTASNPQIEFETNLLSTCEYFYEGNPTVIDEEPTRTHSFTFNDEPNDVYGIPLLIRCAMPFSDSSFEETIYIAKDATPPEAPTFSGEEFTCNGDITVTVNQAQNSYETFEYGVPGSYGTGDKVQYFYALYEDNQLIATGQTEDFVGYELTLDQNSLDNPVSLTANDFDKDYRWEITAIDGVGHRSQTSSFIVQRLDQHNPRCDTQAPTASYEALLTPTGYEVTLSCEDPEENCATNLLYAQLPLGSTCDNVTLNSISSSSKLTFQEDSLLCFQAVDIAQPENHYSPIYEVEITPEVNIKLESPSSGISSQKIFDFTISTQSRNNRNLLCKHGPLSVAAQNLLNQRDYQGIFELSFLQEFEQTDGITHSFRFDPRTSTPVGSLFDENADTDIQDWIIACQEQGAEVYPVRKISLGFDTTPPIINATVEPSLVQNPLDMKATIFASTDEVAYCEYTDVQNNPSIYTPFENLIFEDYGTYAVEHEVVHEYTDQQVLDVTQEIRCYNLAGLSSTTQIDYRVEAKGDLEVTTNLEDFYDTQYIQLEARTPGLWSDCSISVDGDEYSPFNIATGQNALNYVHKHQITLEDGSHQVQVKCESWFNNELGYAYKDIIVDTTDPFIDIQVRDPTCSVSTIQANIVTDGTGSAIVEQLYELQDQEGTVVVEGNLEDFELVLNGLSLNLGETYTLHVFAQDQVGKFNTQSVPIFVATQEHPDCDITPPESRLETRDVYGGKEFTVFCSDEETACTDSFYYYFDDTGACLFDDPEQVNTEFYGNQPILGTESSTFCYFVTDEGLNPSEKKSSSFELVASCYNGFFDTTEQGVDCGGVCALQDCSICRNNIFDDAWEDSLDCGGVCSAICSDGGFIPLQVDIISPQNGVSPTKDFTFSIETNRNAQCRFAKYNPDLPLGYEELYAQMKSTNYDQQFNTNYNGREHSVSVSGDDFAGSSGLESYLESIIIICLEYGDYVPTVVPYFGFDTTPPSMEVLAEPNPTSDPSFLSSLLQVTTDDLTVCKYSNSNTGAQDFFLGEDYYDVGTYQDYRELYIDYWAQDEHDDVQQISCTNLAGQTVEQSYTIEVRPEYSQQITILNDGEYYTRTSGQILLEVETDLYASCQYRLNNEDEFIQMDMVNPFLGLQGSLALATQHQRQIFVPEGEVNVEVVCNMLYDWFGSQEYQYASFIQDSTPPVVDVSLYEKTCSLDSITADIAAYDETTEITDLQYAISVGSQTLRELTSLSQPWSSTLEPFIELGNYEGDVLTLFVVATDEAGNVNEVISTSIISDQYDPLCDDIAPTMDYNLTPVWGGYDLTVSCQDDPQGSGCDDTYGYSFSYETNCLDLFSPWPISTPNFFGESGTLCFRVKDLRPNNAPTETVSLDIDPNCYNYQWDPGEDGIDCGGSCQISCENIDVLCENNIQDPFEEGVDCGGVCQNIRSCIGGCFGDECSASCTNAIQDYNEEGVDCGGACSSECVDPIDPNAPFEIVLLSPEFGIAQQKTFNLEVLTSRPAQCKQGYLAPLHPSDLREWYDRLDDFTQTGDVMHSITMSSNDISRSGEDPEENAYPWIIICEEDGNYYDYPLDYLGYDTTPPNIVIDIQSNPIVNPGDISALISVESDDEVVCTYVDKRGETHYFTGEDVDDATTYSFERQERVSYEGPNNVEYEQTISCRNLAQASSSFTDTVVVDLENQVQITFISDTYQNSRSFGLEVQTVPDASCTYKLLDDGDELSFAQTGSTSHFTQLNGLSDGEHEVLVTCTNLGTGFVGSEHQTFIVDTQAPSLDIQAVSPSCDLNQIQARFFAQDETTTIESFTYDILYQGNFVASGTIESNEIAENFPLVEGGVYTLRATAIDSLGHETQASTQIVASTSQHPDCDFTAPTASLFTQEVWNGVEVTVSCVDQESGCNDFFNYYVAESCGQDYTYYNVGSLSYDNPLLIDEEGTFCAIVYDNAQNPSQELSSSISFVNYCFNGFEDPQEEGVDCGGVCSAQCNTCYNGVQDSFEEGVDCGGVCSSISSCDGGPITPTDFEITLINPAFGISNSKEINLQIHTTRDAQCRHGYLANINVGLDDRYRLFTPFDTTGQQQHQATLDATDVPQLNFNTDEDETSWGIICLEDDMYYFKPLPRFGFDVSEPDLSISYQPNPVFDPADMTNLITVQSDDEVVCTYKDRFGDTHYFTGQDVNNVNTYEESMQARVSYWGYQDETHEQAITCRNIAQTSVQEQETILVQPDNSLEINLDMNDYYGASDLLEVRASTQVQAYCEYQIENTFASMSQTGQTSHRHILNLPDGEYTVTLLCESIGQGLSATVSKDFVVDTSSPQVELVLPTETCSLSALDFSVLLDGTGSPLSQYSYQITDGIDILSQGESSEQHTGINLNLEEGRTYYISVTATDAAGNQGQASSATQATPNSASCDVTPPVGGTVLQTQWDAVHVDITCEDGESGCTNYFSYQETTGQSCEAPFSLGYYTLDLPLRFIEPTTLCYQVYDQAGNMFLGTQTIDVEKQCFNGFEDPNEEGVDCGGVCTNQCLTCNNGVQDPFEEGVDCGGICTQQCEGSGSLSLDLVEPTFGIATTKTFLLEVQTNYDAVCKSGYDTQSSLNLADRYNDLETMSSTGSRTHSTQISASQVSQLNGLSAESTAPWIIICQNNGEYASLEIEHLGFDTTPAKIDVVAQPNPVTNPATLRTELTVLSDDPVVCTYLNENDASTYFPDNDVNNKESYDTTQRTLITYWGVEDFTDNQLIICRNLAQVPTLQEMNIRVQPDNQITMSFVLDEYSQSNQVVLDVTTLQNTYCTYSTTSAGPSSSFDQTGGQAHSKTIFLGEGEHTIEVLCTQQETGLVGVASQTITIDSIAPVVHLISNGASCGTNNYLLAANVDGTGSKIERYDYVLRDGVSILSSGTIDGPELRVPLSGTTQGEVYELELLVTDSAGNQAIDTLSFIVTNSNHELCDLNEPTASAIVDYVWNGAEVTVLCEDAQSGCANEYAYFVDESCNEGSYSLANYYDENPFLVTQLATACYRVFDNAGNFADGQENIDFIPRCFNGFEDPDEEGVDCGGVCSASCGTCSNNRQDEFEEGVDCGGVCSSIRACQNTQSLDIDLLSPRLGISATKTIDFSVYTSTWAYCRQGAYTQNHPTDNAQWYDQLSPFSSTGGTVHEIILNANQMSQLNANQEEDSTTWAVVCENQGLYESAIYTIGFDTTPPIFELAVQPNPVTDPADMTTILGVLSNDPVVCTYLDADGKSIYFEGNDVNSATSFSTQHTTSLSFWTQNNQQVRQLVICRNLAQLASDEQITIDIQANQDFDVTILSPSTTTSATFLLEAQTSTSATCRYDTTGEGNFKDMTQTGSTTHSQLINLYQGTHDVIVSCTDEDGNDAYAYKEITVDYTPPKVEVLVPSQSCSLNQVRATIFTDGTFSDVDYYDYVLVANGNDIAKGEGTNQELIIQTGLVNGQQYQLSVSVYDVLGNMQQVTESFVASQAESADCDTIPPVGSAITIDTWQGAQTTISCQDQESGCSQLFSYSYQENGQCSDATYTFGQLALDNPLLTTESSTLCYAVYDNANNKFEDSTAIDVVNSCYNGFEDPREEGVDCGGPCSADCNLCANGIQDSYEEGVDCGGICSVSCQDETTPQAFAIEVTNPRFGVASTKNFIFEVQTTQQASCRQGYLASARPNTISNWYLTLDEFDATNGKVHNVQIRATNISQLDNNAESSLTTWVVICQHNNDYLIEEIPLFGFDTTPAKIEVVAQPNPIVDPGNAVTTISVESDDLVACTYEDKNGITHYFEDLDITKASSYDTDFSVTLEHWGDNDLSYTSTISCRNIAQLSSTKDIPIRIALTDKVGIDVRMKESYNTQRVIINASTQQLATCQFRFSEDEEYQAFARYNSYEHQRAVTLDGDDDYTVEITCTSESTGDVATKYYDFSIDSQKPELELAVPQNSCGLNEILFSIQADGTGSDMDKYEYSISEDGEEIVSRSTEKSVVAVEVKLKEGSRYVVDVTGYDVAGNSQDASGTFIGSLYDPTTCDTTNPTGKLELKPRWNGIDVNIICEDNENCSTSFDYLASESGLCTEDYALGYYSTDLPLPITESTTFCYTVYDVAGNSYSADQFIDYEPHCFNGIEDPSEEGVDCGGTCLAECGTCYNNYKDLYEEGIDCGGVCQTIRTCSEVGGLYDEFVDTDGDGMDDSWEEYYFGNLEQDGASDYDEDGLSNLEEYRSKTDPTKKDTDGDGLTDLWEITYFNDLDETATGDPDGDTLSNLIEFTIGTNPTLKDITDVDQDGLADQWEQFYFNDLSQGAQDDYDDDGLSNLEEYVGNTNPTLFTQRDQCETDRDCDYGYKCDYTYTCIVDEYFNDDIFDEVEPGANTVGIILLLLGILFIGGGIGYIIYSRKEYKKKTTEMSAKERIKQQEALAAARKKEEEKKAQALAKKRAEQEKARQERLKQRKEQRSNILGTFGESVKKQEEKKAQEKADKKTTETPKQETKKQPSKLDEGLEDEFVDVRDLGKGASTKKEPIKKDLVTKSQEDVFENLAKLSKKNKKNDEKK